VVKSAYKGGVDAMLMFIIVAVVILLCSAVAPSVSAAWSAAEIRPEEPSWRPSPSSGAVLVAFLLGLASPGEFPAVPRSAAATPPAPTRADRLDEHQISTTLRPWDNGRIRYSGRRGGPPAKRQAA
jgi:hypothetical protein